MDYLFLTNFLMVAMISRPENDRPVSAFDADCASRTSTNLTYTRRHQQLCLCRAELDIVGFVPSIVGTSPFNQALHPGARNKDGLKFFSGFTLRYKTAPRKKQYRQVH